jgi:hypothetical protein
MAYQSNKPQATDYMSVSQSDLQNNFLSIKALIDVNHETFGSAYEGKHSIVSFPEQVVSVAAPVFPPATAATELAVYAKADGGATHLFLRPTGQVAGTDANDINISSFVLNPVGGATNSVTLPNGLIMKWGLSNLNQNIGGGKSSIVFPVPFPGNCLNVQVTTTSIHPATNTFVNVYDLLAASFKCTSSTRTGADSGGSIYWFAIGY